MGGKHSHHARDVDANSKANYSSGGSVVTDAPAHATATSTSEKSTKLGKPTVTRPIIVIDGEVEESLPDAVTTGSSKSIVSSPPFSAASSSAPTPPPPAPNTATEEGKKKDPRPIPCGEEIVALQQDVYATAFLLANNATPDMYSFWPWRNRDMWLCWFYLGFILFTQLFVLASLLFIHPPTVDETTHFVNCAAPSEDHIIALQRLAAPTVSERVLNGVSSNLYLAANHYFPKSESLATVSSWAWQYYASATELALASGLSGYFGSSSGSPFQANVLPAAAATAAEAASNDDTTNIYSPSSPDEVLNSTLPPTLFELCQSLNHVLTADVNGVAVDYRALPETTYFYQNMFGSGSVLITILQLVCCVWVAVQVYFADFTQVEALLAYRDFNRWLLPRKGEQLLANGWVMVVPVLRCALAMCVVGVSCCVTCGYNDAIDIVLNSLAFTFISEVPEMFNEPLLKYYTSNPIKGLDPEMYGTDPIYYLVDEYDEANAHEEDVWYDASWYTRIDGDAAGLLDDFTFRHTPADYNRPNARIANILRMVYWTAPVISIALCWSLSAPAEA